MRRTVYVLVLALIATGLYAQDLRIDYRFNVENEDPMNYLQWASGKDVIKDSFDAESGASIAGSTYGFDVARYDDAVTKNAALPGALRNILLFAVSPYGIAKGDNLTVTESKEGLVVRFVHRGTAYELTTDRKGTFNVLTGAATARSLADNIGGAFVLKEEYRKSGTDGTKGADLDWSKITLVPDVRAVSASRWYEGDLKMKYRKGVLTIKGTLEEMKR